MSNNISTFYGWLRYKGRTFLPGTIVKFNEGWLIKHGYSLYSDVPPFGSYNGAPLYYGPCIYGEFKQGCPNCPYLFMRAKSPESFSKAEGRHMIIDWFNSNDLVEAIEEIVGVDNVIHWESLCDNNTQNNSYELKKNPEKDWNQVPEVKILLVIYIILMLASLIFKEPWGAWLVLTVGFIILSNKIIDDASGNGGPYWDD